MPCVSSPIFDSSSSASSPGFFLGLDLFREREVGSCVHRYHVGSNLSSVTCHPLFSEDGYLIFVGRHWYQMYACKSAIFMCSLVLLRSVSSVKLDFVFCRSYIRILVSTNVSAALPGYRTCFTNCKPFSNCRQDISDFPMDERY